jgi:hypothetical protein
VKGECKNGKKHVLIHENQFFVSRFLRIWDLINAPDILNHNGVRTVYNVI